MNKTYRLKKQDISIKWHLIDANNKTLGRLASEISKLLLGKHKPEYEPSLIMGDFVVVINANKVVVTGKKFEQKLYYRHSGYPGGIRSRTFEEQMSIDSTKIIEKAVKGMLPHNVRGRSLFRMLKVYSDNKHPHASQLNFKKRDVSLKESKVKPKVLNKVEKDTQNNLDETTKNSLKKMTKIELVAKAESLHITFDKKLKKDEIIALINEVNK